MAPLALESVKYQIQRYGQGREFQLIAADDGSTDGSQEVIRSWVEENRGLFVKTDLLFRGENAGICRNYVDALRAVEGEIQRETDRLEELRRQEERKRAEVVEAKKETSSIEKLKERKLEDYNKAVLKSDEQFIEEFVSAARAHASA